jgi:hypothetical protein
MGVQQIKEQSKGSIKKQKYRTNLERNRTPEVTNLRQTKRKSHRISNLGRNRTEERANHREKKEIL